MSTVQFKENFQRAYTKVYKMHPNEPENPSLQYVNREWFFHNHLDLVIQNAKNFQKKYYPRANLEVTLFAALFHDTGLVYKRESAAATGHENRSLEYAEKELNDMGYDKDFIKKVQHAIEATEPEIEPKTEEAIIVRTADAYSHFSSVHFFAKSNYSSEFTEFLIWFSKKIESTFKKLAIAEIKKEVRPTYEWYKRALDTYQTEKEKDLMKVLLGSC